MVSNDLRLLPRVLAPKLSRLNATAIADPLRDNIGFARLDFRPSTVS